MSKYLTVSGDYTITVRDGGRIRLDTGVENGEVVITGDLRVLGVTTTIDTVNLTVEDNIITLNSNESGNGITLNESGLEIERGTFTNARLVFDETVNFTNPVAGSGAWNFKTVNNVSLGLQTHQIITPAGGNLYLINSGSGVISVTGTNNYERQVFTYVGGNLNITGGLNNNGILDDDNIPNAKGVVDYITTFFATVFQDRIAEGTITPTYVETKDFEVTGNPSYVDIGVDNVSVARFYNTRTEINDIRINDTTISTTESNADLVLVAPGTGSVRINDTLHINATPSIDDVTIDPSAPGDGVKLYSKTPAYGDTGLYFANSDNKTDEFISNNKALVYSMVF
jgi:hypothetical protein